MRLGILLCLLAWSCEAQGNTQQEFLEWLKTHPNDDSLGPSNSTVVSSNDNSTNITTTETAASMPASPQTPPPSLPITTQPSAQPSNQPTLPVTTQPTPQPSTSQPTAQLSRKPTTRTPSMVTPTSFPSSQPTPKPTPEPTVPLTAQPTQARTRRPTTNTPTDQPTSPPTSPPTTVAPTQQQTRAPTLQPTTAVPTPAPFAQPNLQYRVRSAIFPDKCLTIQGRSVEDAILAPCRPSVLYSNQSFMSIPQVPQFDGDVILPGLVQLVNGVVWGWTFPVDPSSPNQVRLTDVKVYGTEQLLNLSKCASVPRMNEALTYPVYWFPCIVNSSNIFVLEPILAADYTKVPPPAPPSPGMSQEQLSNNAPYGTFPPGTQTPPPATCQPVKMSHIGRHGSRHATDMTQFMSAVSRMVAAQRAGSLTAFGTELLRRSQQVVFNVRNIQLAALTPQGQQEIYNYTLRMAKNFPQIFQNAPNSSIIADSTDLDRTLSSRKQAFYALRDSGVPLTALVSTFAPSVCTTEYNTLRMWEGCRELYLYLADDINFMPASELKVKTMANTTNYALDFYDMVFAPGWELPNGVAQDGRVYDRIQFADDLWRNLCAIEAAYNASDIPTGACSLMPNMVAKLLAYNEDVVSYRSYGRFTPTATTYASSCLLHKEVMGDFEDYIAGKRLVRAHLRFAHRETLLPYLSNMNYLTRDPYFLQDVDWEKREYKTTFARMAANIQKVLYKCGNEKNPTYYLKMMLNEIETVIPGCDSVYCPWEKYKQLSANWGCDTTQFKGLCNGLIVFCGTAREIALSQQANPSDVLAGPPGVSFGSSPFDPNGPFSAATGFGSSSQTSRSKSGRTGVTGGSSSAGGAGGGKGKGGSKASSTHVERTSGAS